MPHAKKQQICREEEPRENLIVVTGFGPFAGHEEVNASWEAVSLLPDDLVIGETTFKLQKIKVPVEYDAVDKVVDDIWSLHPSVVIHCGVNGNSSCVHVEKLAYNNSFHKQDFAGKHLPEGKASLKNCPAKKSAIFSRLNINKIVQVITNECGCTPDAVDSSESLRVAKVSKDVGNYLCGYIYLKSLDQDCSRSLFVHVPPLDKPFSVQKLSEVILKISEECLKQVTEKKSGGGEK